MRKSHKKSRLGCKVCKQRKVKCDEKRPSCARCTASDRRCSYLDFDLQSTSSTSTQTRRPVPTPHCESPGSHISSTELHSDGTLSAERYGLLHFGLFHHFKYRLASFTESDSTDLDGMLELASREALRVPYLMDELLALAAAHKSTLPGEDGDWYRNESIRLQNRALKQFGTDRPEIAGEKPLASFTFSALLGIHTLFDTFSFGTDLPTILDKLVQCIELHHGIRVIASQTWDTVRPLLHGQNPDTPGHITTEFITAIGTECDGLHDRLRGSDISQSTLQIYHDTVKILQYLFDSVRASHSRIFAAVQEWPVRVSQEYISLLRQRRPEALVVLAHYAVLLHYAREFWAVGSSGKFLIRSITGHLGVYWADWLAWPNQVLDNT